LPEKGEQHDKIEEESSPPCATNTDGGRGANTLKREVLVMSSQETCSKSNINSFGAKRQAKLELEKQQEECQRIDRILGARHKDCKSGVFRYVRTEVV
jgi:hypothetical protein